MFGNRKKKEEPTKEEPTKVIEALAEPPRPPKNYIQEAADYFETNYMSAMGPSFDKDGEPDKEMLSLNLLFAIYCEVHRK